jgi:hypothetical protein
MRPAICTTALHLGEVSSQRFTINGTKGVFKSRLLWSLQTQHMHTLRLNHILHLQ